MVGRHPRDKTRPLITAEHPREVIVDEDPATGERRAALKAWYDDVTGRGLAYVFVLDGNGPNGVLIRYQTDKRGPGRLPWGRENWTKVGERRHNLGIPVVPFPCRPELGEEPQPEFAGILDIQDRVNFGVLNRMMVERYNAFNQGYVTGHKFKKVRDPETGLDTVEMPFVPEPGSLWASEGENTKFGQLMASDMLGYLKTYETDIRTMLVTSATPAYYYAGDLINVAVDMIQALDSLHIAKVGEHQANYGEAWEDVFALSALVAGSDADMSAYELRWADPRQLNPAVLADAATKKKAIGYPLGVLAEDLGESPQRVNRILSESAADTLRAALLQPTTPPPAPGQPTPPGQQAPPPNGQRPAPVPPAGA
jgi:hypothetical protein